MEKRATGFRARASTLPNGMTNLGDVLHFFTIIKMNIKIHVFSYICSKHRLRGVLTSRYKSCLRAEMDKYEYQCNPVFPT